jgi:hypothetical protein
MTWNAKVKTLSVTSAASQLYPCRKIFTLLKNLVVPNAPTKMISTLHPYKTTANERK